MVGNEGMIGVALFMGGGSTPNRAIVQRAGHALCLRRQALMAEFKRHEELQKLLLLSLDRPGLEALSCECYAVVKQETDRLLPHE